MDQKEWESLQEVLYWLETHPLQPLTSAPLAAPQKPTKPSYYPDPDPFTYALAHGLDAVEFSVVKYVTRWRKKDGIKDLKKAKQSLERLIELAEAKAK